MLSIVVYIILLMASILLNALCGVITTFGFSDSILYSTIVLAVFSNGEAYIFSSSKNSSPSKTSSPAP